MSYKRRKLNSLKGSLMDYKSKISKNINNSAGE